MDWGAGHYEHTAAQLLAAARVCVERAAPAPEERVIDVGCGTGNAALLAAQRGASVTGVDPARRLLEVAKERARVQQLEVDFVCGEAASLPLADAAAEVLVSVFGVIFAPDAQAASAELARVTAERGRIVLCAWLPGGALFDVMQMRREVIASATSAAPGPRLFAWHDAAALERMFTPFGFSLDALEERLAFTADSPRQFLEAELRDHPMWIAGRAALEPLGKMQEVHDRAMAIYEAANERPDGFQLTSRYVVARLRRV